MPAPVCVEHATGFKFFRILCFPQCLTNQDTKNSVKLYRSISSFPLVTSFTARSKQIDKITILIYHE